MNSSAKKKFLDNEIFSATLGATVQRSLIYREGATEESKHAFRQGLNLALKHVIKQYNNPVTEAVHCMNIETLAKDISANHGDILANGRFRIGSAQKALNLYLKYNWCLGRITTPPHCPIDAVVLAQVPGCKDIKWTQLDSMDGYENAIRNIQTVAKELPLAEWELQLYNKAQSGKPG